MRARGDGDVYLWCCEVFAPQRCSVLKGASAHAQRLWAYRDMVYNLIRKDFRVRYQGAALGFA